MIFVLDGDAAVRDALAAALDCHGMIVCPFGHAAPFLAHPLPSGPICLVVDRALPPAGGLIVLHELKVRDVRPAAVLMSGRLDPTLGDDVQQLVKPFGHDQLIGAIHRAFAGLALPDGR